MVGLKAVKLSTLLIFIICTGCVINPKYENPQEYAREQAKKYPQNADQIVKNGNEIEAKRQYQNTQNILNSYAVIPEKTSGWSTGEPDAFIHLGSNTYIYLHKINITLVCNLDSFLPTPLRRQKIKWKILDHQSGEVETDMSGNLNITIVSKDSSAIKKIELITTKNTYDFSLNGHLILDLKPEECSR